MIERFLNEGVAIKAIGAGVVGLAAVAIWAILLPSVSLVVAALAIAASAVVLIIAGAFMLAIESKPHAVRTVLRLRWVALAVGVLGVTACLVFVPVGGVIAAMFVALMNMLAIMLCTNADSVAYRVKRYEFVPTPLD